MKIKIIIYFFSIIGFACNAFGQSQNKIDSLLSVLKGAHEDTGKVIILNALARALSSRNPDTSIILATQALTLAKKVTCKKHTASAYHLIAAAEFLKGSFTSSLENNFKALSLREELADKPAIASSLNNIGLVYFDQGDYPNALDYYFKALKIDEELEDKNGIASGLNNIGLVYSKQSDYLNALDFYFKALKIAEELEDRNGIAFHLGNIGNVYSRQGDYLKSLDFYFKALKMDEQAGNKRGIGRHLGNIGIVYEEQGNYSKALEYHFTALKITKELGDQNGIAIWLGNIGNIYSKQSDYPKALDYFIEALQIAEELADKNRIGFCLGNIGIIYTKTGMFSEAEVHLKEAISIFEVLGTMNYLKQFEESLSDLYKATGKYKLALEHYKRAVVIKDTLFNQEKYKEITQKETSYKFEKMQAAEKAGHEKQLAVAGLEIKKQKSLKLSFIGVLVLTIISFSFGYRSYRAGQALRLQAIRNKISGDLHDDIGSTLNSISIYSEVARKKDEHQDEALEMIGDASRKIIGAMSDIVWTINPENDSLAKIIFRMKSLAYNLFRAKNIEFTFQSDDILEQKKISIEERRNLYLIFKEAVNNLVKYSKATHVSISMTSENDQIKLVIKDDGVGFNTSQDMEGNGLKIMKRRADEMKSQFKLESSKGNGTYIELILKV